MIERITRSGAVVDVRDPGAHPDLRVADIAWALDGIIRWGGHHPRRVTVCQHSIAMARAAVRPYAHRRALACLWHDAAEAFVGDLATQIKYSPEMAWYRELEADCHASLIRRFEPCLIDYDWSSIKDLDRASLRREALAFPRTKGFLDHEAFRGDPLPPSAYQTLDDHHHWLRLRRAYRERLAV